MPLQTNIPHTQCHRINRIFRRLIENLQLQSANANLLLPDHLVISVAELANLNHLRIRQIQKLFSENGKPVFCAQIVAANAKPASSRNSFIAPLSLMRGRLR